MSLQYLKEDQLYSRLPQGLVDSVDQQGLIQAVVGGIQDSVEDLRAATRRYELFFDQRSAGSFTQAVIVQFTTPTGMVITRALDITDSTPSPQEAPDNSGNLIYWASQQIGVDQTLITSCARGDDLGRAIDPSILTYMAATIGAVIYNTAGVNTKQVLEYYFPRLRIKGTAQSFDVLGRLLGYDDVRMVPLWTRASARVPSDPGLDTNNPDFAERPEYTPSQYGTYDPSDYRDGPYYEFNATGTTVAELSGNTNGLQPWVTLAVYGSPSAISGTYVLSGGDPLTNANAWFDANGNQISKPTLLTNFVGWSITALGNGDSYNGVAVSLSVSSGISLSIVDRLSSIKYRSYYYDLFVTATMDNAVSMFGTKDVLAITGGTNISSGTQYDYVSTDTPVVTGYSSGTVSALNIEEMNLGVDAAIQVMDEVRTATRQVRKHGFGITDRDTAAYAPYNSEEVIVIPAGTVMDGYLQSYPSGLYTATVVATDGIGTVTLDAETIDDAGVLINYNGTLNGAVIQGQINVSNNAYEFGTSGVNAIQYTIDYILKAANDSLNSEPSANRVYQKRPEDTDVDYIGTVRQMLTFGDEVITFGDTVLTFGDDATADQVQPVDMQYTGDNYPVPHIEAGGQVVEIPWNTVTTNESIAYVSQSVAIKDQTGKLVAVTLKLSVTGIPRITISDFPEKYGQIPIGYDGNLRKLEDVAHVEPLMRQVGAKATDPYLDSTYSLYHVGLINGVLVANQLSMLGAPRTDGLVTWMPLNEHPEDTIDVKDLIDSSAEIVFNGADYGATVLNRDWDQTYGWVTNLYGNASIVKTNDYDLIDGLSFAFMLDLGEQRGSGSFVALSHGDLQLTVNNDNDTISLAYKGFSSSVAVFSIVPGSYTWVWGVITASGQVTVGVGDAVAYDTVGPIWPYSEVASVSANFDGDLSIRAQSGGRSVSVRNLMVWNKVKQVSDLKYVMSWAPTPTVCAYWPSWVEDTYTDRYGMRVHADGFVYFDKLPGHVNYNILARVTSYTGMGTYVGDENLRAEGVAGGMQLAEVQSAGKLGVKNTLGAVASSMSASGITVVTNTGTFADTNNAWVSNGSNTYEYLAIDSAASVEGRIAVLSVMDSNGTMVSLGGTDAINYLNAIGEQSVYNTNGAYIAMSNGTYLRYGYYDPLLQEGSIPGLYPILVEYDTNKYSDVLLNPIRRTAWIESSGSSYAVSVNNGALDVYADDKADGETLVSKDGTYITVENGSLTVALGTYSDTGPLFLYDSSYVLYSIDIDNGSILFNTVDVSEYRGTIPGAWITQIDSAGSIRTSVHESQVFTSNDVLVNKSPLAGVLTPNTVFKRDLTYVSEASIDVYGEDAADVVPSVSGVGQSQAIIIETDSCDLDWIYTAVGIPAEYASGTLHNLEEAYTVSAMTLPIPRFDPIGSFTYPTTVVNVQGYNVSVLDRCTGYTYPIASLDVFDLCNGIDLTAKVNWYPVTINLDYGALPSPVVPCQWQLVSGEYGTPAYLNDLTSRHGLHNSGDTVLMHEGTNVIRVFGGDYAYPEAYSTFVVSGTQTETLSGFVKGVKVSLIPDPAYVPQSDIGYAEAYINGVIYYPQGTYTQYTTVPDAYFGGYHSGTVVVPAGTYRIGAAGVNMIGTPLVSNSQIVNATTDTTVYLQYAESSYNNNRTISVGYQFNGTNASPSGGGYLIDGGLLQPEGRFSSGFVNTSEDTYSGVAGGFYWIDFAPVAGYTAPDPIRIDATVAVNYSVIGTYTLVGPHPAPSGMAKLGLFYDGTNSYYSDSGAPWYEIGVGTVPPGLSPSGMIQFLDEGSVISVDGTITGGSYSGSVTTLGITYVDYPPSGQPNVATIYAYGSHLTDATMVSFIVPITIELTENNPVVIPNLTTYGELSGVAATDTLTILTSYAPDSVTVYECNQDGTLLSEAGAAGGVGTSYSYNLNVSSLSYGDHYFAAVSEYSGSQGTSNTVVVRVAEPDVNVGYLGIATSNTYYWELLLNPNGIAVSEIGTVIFYKVGTSAGNDILAGYGTIASGSIVTCDVIGGVYDAFYGVIDAVINGNACEISTPVAYCANFASTGSLVSPTPTGLSATAHDGSVGLSWNAVPGADGYDVWRSVTSGTNYAVIATIGSNTYSDVSVSNGTQYFYEVDSFTGTSTSAHSSEVSATPMPVPAAPVWQWGTTVGTNTNTFAPGDPLSNDLGWYAVDGATEYILYKNNNIIAVINAPGTAYYDYSITAETVNSYYLLAYNSYGLSAPSEIEKWMAHVT